ncbi:MAG TPA: hypothetical protein VEY93_09945 [Longimicrobium sp.]|nr:hypothetical protein [Longimicrobium sp.]
MCLRLRSAAFALLCLAAVLPASAQSPDSAAAPARRSVLSILPIHSSIGFYAGDFEQALSPTLTLGAGAGHFSIGDYSYTSLELKGRFYPSEDALNGVSVGMTLGPTFLSEEGNGGVTAIGIGFEAAKSHLFGDDRRMYLGYGVGGKRLFFTDEAAGAQLALPTLRFSVGYAF